MRQTLLLLAIAFGSPLATAQDAGDAATSSVIGADASQHQAAAASAARDKPARKPVSAIGRALAELLQANRATARAPQPRTVETGTPDIGAAQRTELAARTEPDSTP